MIISPSHIIESDRLLLRVPSIDIDEISTTFSATRYKGFNDGMLWEAPNTPNELIEPFKNNIKALHDGSSFTFSIVKKAGDLFIGRIAIQKEAEPNTWNLGFWMHPEHQNQGNMSEAVKVIMRFGFEQLSAEKIIADHSFWNKASEAVLEKCGMVFLKHIEKGFKKNGIWIAKNRLELTKTTWLKFNKLETIKGL